MLDLAFLLFPSTLSCWSSDIHSSFSGVPEILFDWTHRLNASGSQKSSPNMLSVNVTWNHWCGYLCMMHGSSNMFKKTNKKNSLCVFVSPCVILHTWVCVFDMSRFKCLRIHVTSALIKSASHWLYISLMHRHISIYCMYFFSVRLLSCFQHTPSHIIHRGYSAVLSTNKVHVRWGRGVFGPFGWKSKDLANVVLDVEINDWNSLCTILSFYTSAPHIMSLHLLFLLLLLLFWTSANGLVPSRFTPSCVELFYSELLWGYL